MGDMGHGVSVGDVGLQAFTGPREHLNRAEKEIGISAVFGTKINPVLDNIRKGIEDIMPMFPGYHVKISGSKVMVTDEQGKALLNLWHSVFGWQGSTYVSSHFMKALYESPCYGLPCTIPLEDAKQYEPRFDLLL